MRRSAITKAGRGAGAAPRWAQRPPGFVSGAPLRGAVSTPRSHAHLKARACVSHSNRCIAEQCMLPTAAALHLQLTCALASNSLRKSCKRRSSSALFAAPGSNKLSLLLRQIILGKESLIPFSRCQEAVAPLLVCKQRRCLKEREGIEPVSQNLGLEPAQLLPTQNAVLDTKSSYGGNGSQLGWTKALCGLRLAASGQQRAACAHLTATYSLAAAHWCFSCLNSCPRLTNLHDHVRSCAWACRRRRAVACRCSWQSATRTRAASCAAGGRAPTTRPGAA